MMLPIGQFIQNVLRNLAKDRAVQHRVIYTMSKPATQQYFLKTFNELVSTCRVSLKNREIEATTVVNYIQNTYSVGNVSDSTVLVGDHIVNDTTINIHITVQNYRELENMLSEISEIRRQLNDNSLKSDNYDVLKLFVDKTLDPFLENFEKILTESVEYDKLKFALKSEVQ